MSGVIRPGDVRLLPVKLMVPEAVLEQWANNRAVMEQIMANQQRALCVLVARLGGTVELSALELAEADEVLHGEEGTIGLFTYRNGMGDVRLRIGPRVDEEESADGHGQQAPAETGGDVPAAEGDAAQPAGVSTDADSHSAGSP